MEHLNEMLDQKYPQFNTISPQHLLSDALHQMLCENVEYLIVLENDQFVGLLSEHDITQKLLFVNQPLEELTVSEFMNRNLPVASSADTVAYAMQLLDRYNSRYMAIYDGFDFKGVVSENDLLKSVISTQPKLAASENQAYPWAY